MRFGRNVATHHIIVCVRVSHAGSKITRRFRTGRVRIQQHTSAVRHSPGWRSRSVLLPDISRLWRRDWTCYCRLSGPAFRDALVPRCYSSYRYLSKANSLIYNLKISKSPGYDNIGASLIKAVVEGLVRPLAYIYNLSIETGIFPENLNNC